MYDYFCKIFFTLGDIEVEKSSYYKIFIMKSLCFCIEKTFN